MSLSSYPRGQRKAAPPFSYTIFVLAFFEALLWLHPLLEAQNATKNNFTFSLCDFLQENVSNLKSVWSATSELYQAAQHPPEHEYSDQWELMDDEAEQRLHFSLQELAEARGHLVENVTVNSNIAYGRTKRMLVLTFHETQQKKDGTESISGKTKTKENQTLFSPVVDYLRYIVYLAVLILSMIAQGKGKRLLPLFSFLPLLSFNGAAALSLDEIGSVEPVSLSDHKGFYYFLQLITPSKALFLVLVFIMLVVYLLLCFWLSVGWLHFAKRLLFGTAPRHRKEDGNDIEQGYKGDEEEDYESEPEVEKEPEPKKVSSMTPGVMVDFKFKTNVLSDALVAYSSILNVSTLKSILFDHSNQEVNGDDRE